MIGEPGLVHLVTFGSRELRFSVVWRRRKTLAISVEHGGGITVVAPEGVSVAEVEARVRRRAAWIVRQQVRFESMPLVACKRRFVSGETFSYRGREYRLRVGAAPAEAALGGVLLSRPFLHVRGSRAETAAVKRRVERWFRLRAEALLRERVDQCIASSSELRGLTPVVRLQRMRKRWGSCSARGTILLHPLLVQAPSSVIDYVVTHELCHLRHLHHGKAFYALLDRVMPDWRQRRKKLDGLAVW